MLNIFLLIMRIGFFFIFYNCLKFFCNFIYNMYIFRIIKGCYVLYYRVGYSIFIMGVIYLEVI